MIVGYRSTDIVQSADVKTPDFLLRKRLIFGFEPASMGMDQIGTTLLRCRRKTHDRVGLVVTPNIDHITHLKKNKDFLEAYAFAAMILCDGFPIYYYARACGHQVHHITGCDLTAAVLSDPRILADGHRFFFVVDSLRTEIAVREWADSKGLSTAIKILVPPQNFNQDTAWCNSTADAIREFGTTILFMAVGAPQSEIFVYRHRDQLPACWALCVGQAVKVNLNLVNRAPKFMRQLYLEWLWRLFQEPRRLIPRYAVNCLFFIPSLIEDIVKSLSSH